MSRNKDNKTKEDDDTMAAIQKPGAFVLNSSKVKEFLAQKSHTSSDALSRFEQRKPKEGIVTPFKK